MSKILSQYPSEKHGPMMFDNRKPEPWVGVAMPISAAAELREMLTQADDQFREAYSLPILLEALEQAVATDGCEPMLRSADYPVVAINGSTEVLIRYHLDRWRKSSVKVDRHQGHANYIEDPPKLPKEFWAHLDALLRIVSEFVGE